MRHLLVFGILLILNTSSYAENCVSLPVTIQNTLAAAAADARAYEPCEYREIARGDLNGDSLEDYTVVFTLEGACEDSTEKPGTCGNQFEQFLQVFYAGKGDPQPGPSIKVGAKFSRTVENLKIVDDKVHFDTAGWGPKDPGCCPTIRGTGAVRIQEALLTEIE